MPRRMWTTAENSQGSFGIEGDSLPQALRDGLGGLVADARPDLAGSRIVRSDAAWRLDVLGGQGGVEVVTTVRDGRGEETEVVCWLHARPDELPYPLSLVG